MDNDINEIAQGDGIETWQEVMLVYNAAMRQVQTKIEILNEEFQHIHQYNPIEHIKCRMNFTKIFGG